MNSMGTYNRGFVMRTNMGFKILFWFHISVQDYFRGRVKLKQLVILFFTKFLNLTSFCWVIVD